MSLSSPVQKTVITPSAGLIQALKIGSACLHYSSPVQRLTVSRTLPEIQETMKNTKFAFESVLAERIHSLALSGVPVDGIIRPASFIIHPRHSLFVQVPLSR